MAMNIADRVYDHSFRIDPIVRTLMDTDFYKLLMQQLVQARFPAVQATFSLINRTRSVRLADVVDEAELRAQLDHARTLRFQRNELIWLAGNTFYGQQQIFSPEFMHWLTDFRLPPYELRREDGQYVLTFEGPWAEVSAWEIPALSIINELRARAATKGMSRVELDILYSGAKTKLWKKMVRLRKLQEDLPGALKVSDFGTRRRHGFLWQRWCIEAAMEGLSDGFIGTSNVKHAMDLGLEAIGTNAHELPMVYAALASKAGETPGTNESATLAKDGDEVLRKSSYRVLEDWAEFYGQRLQVFLPDAHGTTGFLKRAPDWVADWTGIRPDSKDPVEGVYEYISWLRMRGRDPTRKIAILSDGMTVDSIDECVRRFHGKIGATPIGWGTDLTNDFSGCSPIGNDEAFRSMSLVCKVTSADGIPAVKLSDNPNKATGPADEIARYMRVFGDEGMQPLAIRV